MRIGYLGPEGTYTQQAAAEFILRLRHTNQQLIPINSIDDLLDLLNQGDVDLAVVPLRNSIAGDYQETLRGMQKYKFSKLDFLDLQIKLALGIHPDSDPPMITKIISKDTALRGCSDYLSEFSPSATQVPVDSTAKAMKDIKDQYLLEAAAVGSVIGMNLYGLKIINDDVGNKGGKDNVTTFLYLIRANGAAK